MNHSEFYSPAVPKFWRRNEVIVWNLLIIHKNFRISTLFHTPNAKENTSTNRFMYNLGIRAHQYHKLFKNNYRVHYKVSVTLSHWLSHNESHCDSAEHCNILMQASYLHIWWCFLVLFSSSREVMPFMKQEKENGFWSPVQWHFSIFFVQYIQF